MSAQARPAPSPAKLLREIRRCRVCADSLPHAPRPVLQLAADARILVAGQAPGRRVHESGIPFDDPSGERLRDWMGVDGETFYDASKVAIVPMGFCYPGTGSSGDHPPRPECAPLWHERLTPWTGRVRLRLLIGRHAQRHWLGDRAPATLTETVERWRDFGTHTLPLPHPSPRNRAWFSNHPWFEREILPVLRRRVRRALAGR